MKRQNKKMNPILRCSLFALILGALLLSALLTSCSKEALESSKREKLSYLSENESYKMESYENDYGIVNSTPAGIYTNTDYPQYATLTTDTKYTIRYTKSADRPTSKSEIAENGSSIKLLYKPTDDGKGTDIAILRCALFDGDKMVGQVQTYSYFTALNERFSTPVFSFIGDSDDLFGYENGIYVSGKLRDEAKKHGNPEGWNLGNTNANYYQTGRMSERDISIEMSDSGFGAYTFSSNGGVRINGGYTRCNTQKSLKFFSRKEYTPKYGTFDIVLFPGYRDPVTKRTVSFADSFLLRGGSNNEGNTVISTPFQLMMATGTDLNVPAMRPVTEYLNGQYKGVFMMTEDYDADYFEAHYGIEEKDLLLMTGCYENYGGSMYTLDVGTDEDLDNFKATMKALGKLDMTVDENYKQFCDTIDEKNFIQYMCFELFCCNSDWPDNNLKIFRYSGDNINPDEDSVYNGKWRFLLKDLDLAFGHGHSVESNPYTVISSPYSTFHLKEIFTKCMKNYLFKQKVYSFMMTLCSQVFTEDRVSETLETITLAFGQEMAVTTKTLGVGGGSTSTWMSNVDSLNSFAKKRVKNVAQSTKKASKADYTDITVNITGDGSVRFGWFPIESGETVQYLTKNIIPIEFSSEAEIRVTGGSVKYDKNGRKYVYMDSKSGTVNVTFTPADGVANITEPVINEVGYRNCDNIFIEIYNPTGGDMSLDGYAIDYGNGLEKQPLDGYSIPAYGYFVLADADIAENCAPIKHVIKKSTVLSLTHDEHSVDVFSLYTSNRTIHLGRYPDGGEITTLYTSELTPGYANKISAPYTISSGLHDGLVFNGVFTSFKSLGSDGTTVPSQYFYDYFSERQKAHISEFKFFRNTKTYQIPVDSLKQYLEDNTHYTVRYNSAANLYIIVLDK